MSIEREGGRGGVERVGSPFCVCKKCVPEICQETGIAENIGKLIATEYETHEATVNQFIIANQRSRSRTNFLQLWLWWLKGSAPKCLVFQSTTAIINLARQTGSGGAASGGARDLGIGFKQPLSQGFEVQLELMLFVAACPQ